MKRDRPFIIIACCFMLGFAGCVDPARLDLETSGVPREYIVDVFIPSGSPGAKSLGSDTAVSEVYIEVTSSDESVIFQNSLGQDRTTLTKVGDGWRGNLNIPLATGTVIFHAVASNAEGLVLYRGQTTVIVEMTSSVTIVVEHIVISLRTTLSSDVKKPIEIALSGCSDTMEQGTTMVITAAGTPDPEEWRWYLDGTLIPQACSASMTVGEGLLIGSIHSVTAIGKKSDIMGSASVRFRVVGSE